MRIFLIVFLSLVLPFSSFAAPPRRVSSPRVRPRALSRPSFSARPLPFPEAPVHSELLLTPLAERADSLMAPLPADPLHAALRDLDARMARINAPDDPRYDRQINEFLRSVDMARLVRSVRDADISIAGDNLPKALWRGELSLIPVIQPTPFSPRTFLILDNRTGRSLPVSVYITEGFPPRIE